MSNIKLAHNRDTADFRSVYMLRKAEHIQEYFRSPGSFEKVFICKFKKKNELELKPKADAFGRFHIKDLTITIYPKYLVNEDGLDVNALTNLFFVGEQNAVDILRNNGDVKLKEADVKELGLDFYFYLNFLKIYKAVASYNKELFMVKEQEVSSVRGKIDFQKSISRFGGLKHKHICLTSETKFRDFLLGCVKSHVLVLQNYVTERAALKIAKKSLRHLADISPVALTKDNLKKLKDLSKQVALESSRMGKLVDQICSSIEKSERDVLQLGASGFVFNMDYHFEKLVDIFVKKAFGKAGKSGNDGALDFLGGCAASKGIATDEIHRSLRLEPDNYIEWPTHVPMVMDAKYKIVKQSGNRVTGIDAGDLHQLLAYWVHFLNQNEGKIPPKLALIYPSQNNDSNLIEDLGTFRFNANNLDGKVIDFSIWKFNMNKALSTLRGKSLSSGIDEFREHVDVCIGTEHGGLLLTK